MVIRVSKGMNSTIKQYSGPSSTRKEKGLPKAAKKFAQQMGLDLTGLEAEAEDMWEMLNKMSVEEPAAYENFVEEQMKQQKAEQNIPENEKPKGRMFRPHAGFCIKCRTTGNDGIKVRDFGSNSGKDFYLNFVSHEAIEAPKDRNGKPVLDDRGASADGLEIPLLIGPSREVDSLTLAVDVVVHPVIIARCESYSLFKTQVIDLALEWTTQEIGVLYNKKYEIVPWNYHGGRGADKDTPVLFPVDEVLERQGKDTSSPTDSLLDSIKVEKRRDNLLDMSVPSSNEVIPIELSKTIKEKKHVGIQEIREDGTIESQELFTGNKDMEKKTTKKKKTTPAVKKGFLNNNKKSLYPEGSSEGQNGGAYARLMSRCQVVDTTKLPTSCEGQVNPHVSSGTALPPPPPEEFGKTKGKTYEKEIGENRPKLTVNEQNEIDSMFSGFDEDFATSLSMDKDSTEANDIFSQHLADFAKALTGPVGANRDKDAGLDQFIEEVNKSSNISSTTNTKKNGDAACEISTSHKATFTTSDICPPTNSTDSTGNICKVTNKLPKHIKPNIQVFTSSEGQKKELRIVIDNVDKTQQKGTDLQVSESKIIIAIPSIDEIRTDGTENRGGSLLISPPFLCDVKTVKASMSSSQAECDSNYHTFRHILAVP